MSPPPFQQASRAAAMGSTPDVSGRCFSVRVVRFTSGARIAFNQPDNVFKVLAACNYPFPKEGWERVYLDGTLTIEYSSRPEIILEPVNAPQDASGNQAVVGPTAPAVAPTGSGSNPVLGGGIDGGGLAQVAGVGVADANPAPPNVTQVGGQDPLGSLRVLPVADGVNAPTKFLPVGGKRGGAPFASKLIEVDVPGVDPVAAAIPTCGVDGSGLAQVPFVDSSGRQKLLAGDGQVVIANAVTSPAAASTVLGPTVDITGFTKFSGVARIRGATGGVLDVYLQTGDGTNWWDVIHFTQLAAAGALVAWAFSLERGGGGTIVAVNTADGTPLLAANTRVPGLLGNKLRYAFVAGAGTSAGGAQDIRGWGSA